MAGVLVYAAGLAVLVLGRKLFWLFVAVGHMYYNNQTTILINSEDAVF